MPIGIMRRRRVHESHAAREEKRRRLQAESWQRMRDQIDAKHARHATGQRVSTHA